MRWLVRGVCTSHAKERPVKFSKRLLLCSPEESQSCRIGMGVNDVHLWLFFPYALSPDSNAHKHQPSQTRFRVIAQFTFRNLSSHPLFALAQHLNLIGFKVRCRTRRNNQLQYEPRASETRGDLISQHMASPVLKHIAHPRVSHSNICGQFIILTLNRGFFRCLTESAFKPMMHQILLYHSQHISACHREKCNITPYFWPNLCRVGWLMY